MSTTTRKKKNFSNLLKARQNLARSLLSPKLQMSLHMTKPTKWSVSPAKTKVSLVIRPVWSESSLSARGIIGSFSYQKSAQRRLWSESSLSARGLGLLATTKAHSEDSDQTGRMPRLIWVFAGRTTTLLVLSCCDSNQTILQGHNLDLTTHSPMSILIHSFMLQQPLHTYARTHRHAHTHIFSCKFLVSLNCNHMYR